MMRVRNTTAHAITSPLPRVANNFATAEKGRSAVARMFAIFIAMFLMFAIPTYAYAATYGGWNESGGGTITYGAFNGSQYQLNISWSAGNTGGGNNVYLRDVVLCDDGWHYGEVYTDYPGAYPAGSYNGFAVPIAICSTMGVGTWKATGVAFTGYSNYSINAGGRTAANTLIPASAMGTLLDATFAVGYTPGPSPAPTGTGNACTLTDVSLVRLARGGGFPETAIQKAVAIAIAESGGKVNALHYNSNDSYDIGVWQINDVAHSTYDRNLLYTSPGYNAAKAYDTFHTAPAGADTFTPWATYNSGAYNKFMSRAATALQNAATGTLGGNSCSDLSGGDVVAGATAGADTPADDDPNCTFTFNVFKILKCAFIPSSQDAARYSTRINSIKGNPPVSTIIGSVTFFTDTVNVARTCGGTCPGNNDPYNPIMDNGAQIQTQVNDGLPAYSFNPIQETGDWIQGTSRNGNTHSGALHTLGAAMYLIAQIVIWCGAVWFIYNQITGSVGGRE